MKHPTKLLAALALLAANPTLRAIEPIPILGSPVTKLEHGKFYVFETTRDASNKYLMDASIGKVLERSGVLNKNCVWTIIEDSVKGAVAIKNEATGGYLFSGGYSAIASSSESPVDIYLFDGRYNAGSIGLSRSQSESDIQFLNCYNENTNKIHVCTYSFDIGSEWYAYEVNNVNTDLPVEKIEMAVNKVKYCVYYPQLLQEAVAVGVADGNFSLDGLEIADYITYDGVDYPVTSIANNAFKDITGFKGELKIGKNVKGIGASAFSGCTGLTSLKLQNGLTTIGNNAFDNCRSLAGSLDLPQSLTSIGKSAFYGCTGFRGSLNLSKSLTSIGNNAFQGCSGFNGSLNLPESLTSIGDGTFYNCSNLTGSLNLPESLISIGSSAFYNCSNLTGSLNLPESLISIGSSAFYNCSGLTGSLNLPESLTSIGSSVFSGCRGLNGSLNIPANISTINGGAFAYTNFEKVICHRETAPECSTDAFSGARKEILQVPENSITAYMLKKPWNEFANVVSNEPLTGIEFARANVICPLGCSVKLKVNKTPFWAEGEISFISGNTAVATVDADGVVTGVAKGSTEIIATSGTLTASCIVTVKDLTTSTVSKLEAGTADAPNYYVLKAGRGTPYLAYSEEYLETSNGVNVRLHRTANLTSANIWAVTPGDADGTLHITAYGTTRGLMNFVNSEGASYGVGAFATAVKPQDVYPVYQANGTVSLCLNTAVGYATVDGATEYYTLDASNHSDFLGNWIPGDNGTNWTAFQLDMTNGVDAALAAATKTVTEEAAKTLIATKVASLNAYIANVPWVADDLNAGIEALNALVIDADYEAKINEIWNNCTAAANETLGTVFNGKTLAFKNLRRAALGVTPYMGISTLETPEKYYGVTSFIDVTADFTLKSVGEGGYTIYNEATKTWVSTSCAPTTDETAAQTFYPFLHAHGAYTGLALAQSSKKGGPGLNFQSWEAGAVSYWSVNDEGSIWSLVVADDAAKAKDVTDAYVAKLEPYVPALPDMVANILTTAIDEIKALKYSETLGEEAATIADNALAAANELLAGGMNGMKLTLKNLRQNKFISIADNVWVYDEYNEADETVFTFKAQADGGYILYNEAANIYVGEAVTGAGGSYTNVTVAYAETDAQVVYPFLCKGGAFTGVALALEANPTKATTALNTDNDACILHTYRAGDGGSIFALIPFETIISDVAATALEFEGIIGNVGETVAIGAKVLPADVTDPTISWHSSNPEVAAVDTDGVVWFNAAGNAIVTAECQGYEFSVPFVVKEVIATALNVFPVEAIGGVGHEFSLLALHEPENTTDKSVTWESSDPEVATVSEDGRVSLASLGSAKITARSGEHTATCSVTVDDIVSLTEMASSGVVIDIVDGGIVVRNVAAGESIAIYTVDGKVANGAIVESDETRLNLAAGIYIVKVSPATVAKVLIK